MFVDVQVNMDPEEHARIVLHHLELAGSLFEALPPGTKIKTESFWAKPVQAWWRSMEKLYKELDSE